MKKTYCDHCGSECGARCGSLMLTIAHFTSQKQEICGDDFLPIDLCGDCIDDARTRYGFKIRQYMNEMAAEYPEPMNSFARAIEAENVERH